MNEFVSEPLLHDAASEQHESGSINIHAKAVELISRRGKGFEKLLDAMERTAYSYKQEPNDETGPGGLEETVDPQQALELLVEMMLVEPAVIKHLGLDKKSIDLYLAKGGNEEFIDARLDEISQIVISSYEAAESQDEYDPTASRKEVQLTPEDLQASTAALAEKYDISRTTAWRAKKRGFYVENVRAPRVEPDEEWNRENIDLVQRKVRAALHSLMNTFDLKSINRYVELDDLEQEAIYHILRQSGKAEFRELGNTPHTQDREARETGEFLYSVALHHMQRIIQKFIGRSAYDSLSLDTSPTEEGTSENQENAAYQHRQT